MANSYLFRNFTSAGNRKTFTFSTWVKFSDATSISTLFATGADSENRLIFIRHDSGSGSSLKVDGKTSTSQTIEVRTNRAFRDTNAWYHIVLRVDTTQSTAADRVRIYVNGVQETSFAQSTYPSQNYDTEVNKTANHMVGRYSYSASNYLNGYMSHAAFVDGASLAPTSFGETDSTSGIWKFKPPSGITWGTNGFHLKFENSGNLGLDSSSNTANWTSQGDLKQSLDTPSNVYATMNPLYNFYRDPTLSIGNTKIVDTNGWSGAKATLGFSTGKWYWEIKLTGTMENHQHGVQQENVDTISQDPQQRTGTTVFYNHDGGEMRVDGTATTADYGLYSSGDIMGVAVDMTAGSYGQITYYKNGVALISNYNLSSSSTLVMPFSSVGACTSEYNFGNGFFGTTAITSAGSNGNGSLFEYDVPSNHYALNTKNLNTYG